MKIYTINTINESHILAVKKINTSYTETCFVTLEFKLRELTIFIATIDSHKN